MAATPASSASSAPEWRLAHGRRLSLAANARLMGILNVTPDSFSDGARFSTTDEAVAAALAMEEAGAAIIDIGGESTRPGGAALDARTEQARVLPVVSELARRSSVLISIDTYRSETGRLAIEAGAHILNDVTGLHGDPAMARLAAETGAGLCIMHTGRNRQKDPDVIADQRLFLDQSLEIAAAAGVSDEQIILDPGFGFAKDVEENMALLARFDELSQFGRPLLAGTSRKRFLGALIGRDAAERDIATAASTVLLRLAGAAIIRVHDVAANKDALAVAEGWLAARAQIGRQE